MTTKRQIIDYISDFINSDYYYDSSFENFATDWFFSTDDINNAEQFALDYYADVAEMISEVYYEYITRDEYLKELYANNSQLMQYFKDVYAENLKELIESDML